MEIKSTEIGLQVYTATFMAPTLGKNGVKYGPYSGMCLLPEHLTDSVNNVIPYLIVLLN